MRIIDTTAENIRDFGICGYRDIRRPGYPEKLNWLEKRFQEGLRIKTLYSEKDGPQGMIEYIPGKYCWRPVEADGYMFIHCIFLGFKRIYKGKGYGTLLLNECLEDAKTENMSGVAVVTRKGAFMAGKELFIKNDFQVKDSAPSDFELLVKTFNKKASVPRFKKDLEKRPGKFSQGLTIIRADQCPYTVKNVYEIIETAQKKFGLKPKLVDLKDHQEAQNSPCAYGVFCIVYDGKVVAEHPISNTRFTNIMDKILSSK